MRKKTKIKGKICIIGVGKVGSAIFHNLYNLGYDIAYAIDTNLKRLKIITADFRNIKISDKITKEYINKSNIIIFAVAEKSLTKVINNCSKYKMDFSGKILFHLSGMETSGVFGKLKINKDNIGSFHPLQTFNKISFEYNNLLNNIYFGIEGGANAIKYLIGLSKKMRSKYIIIPKEKKILYHSACVIASNFLVSHFNIITKITKELSLDNKESINIFKPIVYTTLENIFKNGASDSLTGPFERGDLKTIDLHLKNLKDNLPSILYYYVLLGIEAMNLAKDKKSITKKEALEIEKIFLKHI